MFLRKTVLIMALGLLASPGFCQDLNPGKWQVTIEMQMAGMKMPPATATQCITKEQAAKAEGALPKNLGGKDDDCKLSDVKVEGNHVSYKLACPKNQIAGEGKFEYSGDAYTGTMHISMPGAEMTQKFTGTRLGECDR